MFKTVFNYYFQEFGPSRLARYHNPEPDPGLYEASKELYEKNVTAILQKSNLDPAQIEAEVARRVQIFMPIRQATDQEFEKQEEDRQLENQSEYVLKFDPRDGQMHLYSPKTDDFMIDLFKNYESYLKDKGEAHKFNYAEANAVREMDRQIAQGDVKTAVYAVSDTSGSVRYINQFVDSGSGVFKAQYIDVGQFVRDMTHEEANDVLSRMGIVAGDVSLTKSADGGYPYLISKTKAFTISEIRDAVIDKLIEVDGVQAVERGLERWQQKIAAASPSSDRIVGTPHEPMPSFYALSETLSDAAQNASRDSMHAVDALGTLLAAELLEKTKPKKQEEQVTAEEQTVVERLKKFFGVAMKDDTTESQKVSETTIENGKDAILADQIVDEKIAPKVLKAAQEKIIEIMPAIEDEGVAALAIFTLSLEPVAETMVVATPVKKDVATLSQEVLIETIITESVSAQQNVQGDVLELLFAPFVPKGDLEIERETQAPQDEKGDEGDVTSTFVLTKIFTEAEQVQIRDRVVAAASTLETSLPAYEQENWVILITLAVMAETLTVDSQGDEKLRTLNTEEVTATALETLTPKQIERKSLEHVARFGFMMLLLLMLAQLFEKDEGMEEKLTEESFSHAVDNKIGVDAGIEKVPEAKKKKSVVSKVLDESPWILLAIIWQMSMIREMALSQGQMGNVKGKKGKKKLVKTLPKSGVIYLRSLMVQYNI